MEVETANDDLAAAQARYRIELRRAVVDLSARGLKLAAKWAAEQLLALPEASAEDEELVVPYSSSSSAVGSFGDKLLFAKSLFDVGEYQRAALVIAKEGAPLGNVPALPLFVRQYALYLAGEKRKTEETTRPTDPLAKKRAVNPNLPALYDELAALHDAEKLDGFGCYIFGVVVRETHAAYGAAAAAGVTGASAVTAKDLFVEAVRKYPWNWSAWLDLAAACLESDTVPEELEAERPETFMYIFFLQHLWLAQQHTPEALQVLEELQVAFPRGSYILAQVALAHYHSRDFERGHELFVEVMARDPLRLELLDTFSNILYVKECRAELSHLAHNAMKNDKYRPETCCIVGNYYSIKHKHEMAVTYFLRALRLDERFLSAWTLMGHEFLELKNTGAAIEAYRRAVDINSKDYRAWYGLGQTYEILQMYLYTLYYYRKATTLRPYDARMWTAMGSCYERLGRRGEAVKAYERATVCDDPEGLATVKLAKLYAQDGRRDKAAQCYHTLLKRTDLEQATGPDMAEALLFLANYHRSNPLTRNLAATYATRLLEFPGQEQEEAKAVLREIRSLEGGGPQSVGSASGASVG